MFKSFKLRRAVRQLALQEQSVRLAAIKTLGQTGDAHVVEPLIACLGDGSMEVRRAAMEALGQLGDGRAVEPLVAILFKVRPPRDMSDAMQQVGDGKMAAQVLGQLGDRRAVEPLIAYLRMADWPAEAAIALGQLGDVRALEPLLAAFRSERWTLSEAAGKALSQMGSPVVRPLLLLDSEAWHLEEHLEEHSFLAKVGWRLLTPTRAQQVLLEIGPLVVESLVVALRDEDALVRKAAVLMLGRVGDGLAVGHLVTALGDEDARVRETAVGALGQMRNAPIVEPLLTVLKDENASVRRAVVLMLGQIRDAHVVEPLLASLHDEDGEVRRRAVQAVGQMRDAPIVEPLLTALGDEDSQVRGAAGIALGQLGDTRAVGQLVTTLLDESSPMRGDAMQLLMRLGDERAVEPLVTLTGDFRWAEEALTTLRIVLERSAACTVAEVLQKIVALNNVVKIVHIENAVCKGVVMHFGGDKRVPLDSTYVRQLARQELLRRGIKA